MQPPTAVHSSSSTAPAGLDKFFIPARSTRHRIAAIALYRALIALASSVPLPPDLTEAWNKTQTPRRRQPEAPARNPLVELVRRTFKRNRADTSPRIVAPALHAGYRSLELLRDAAKTEGTPSRDQVVGLVREQLAIRQRSHDARQAWLERHPPPPEDSDQPTEPHHDDQHRDKPRPLPLLVRISPDPTPENPFPRIQYATPNHPRPQSELGGSGRRYVPHVDMANDFAILRRRRPQDHGFSNVLRRKMDRRGVRMALYKEMQEIDVPDARLEDEWDDAMRELVEDELLLRAAERRGGGGGGGGGGQRHESHTGGSSVTPAEQHLSRVLLDIVQEQEQQQQHHHQQQQHSSSSADPLPSSSSSSSSPFPSSPSSTATFAATVSHHGKAYLERKMSREAEDALARSAALHALVASERALAAREKVERDAARRAGWEAKMAAEHGESGWRGVVAREKAARDEARGRRIEMATRAALQSWGGGGGGGGGGGTGEDDDRGERSAAASAVVVEGRMWRRHVPRVYMDKSEFLLQLKQAPGGRGGSGSGSGGRGDRKESYAGKRPSGGKGDGGNRGTKTGDGWRQPRKDGDHQHNRAGGGPGGGGKRGPHDGNMRR